MKIVVYFICIGFTGFLDASADSRKYPIVYTPLGKIRGSILKSRLGRDIYSFRGIRYAEPPVNELRFQPPVPISRWRGTFDASRDGPICPQNPSTTPSSEDCLRLNVYTTKLPSTTDNPKRPTIAYIHGGALYAYTSGSSRLGPQYFMDRDIVLVTIDYRLGNLGFVSTGTKEAPGNNGMKDQVMALRWIKKYVHLFGGDPDSITLMGYSAGGASVMLHMFSPMSRGLFHRVAAMSGAVLGQYDFRSDQLDLAKKQARLVNCRDDSPSKIMSCFQNISADDFSDTLMGFKEFGPDPIWIWLPVIEKDFGQERFLTAHPVNLARTGQFQKVPLMTGQTEFEFGYEAYGVVNNKTLEDQINSNFDQIAPLVFAYEKEGKHSKLVSRSLRSFYFHNKTIDKSQLENLSNLYADSIIAFSVNRAAKLISQISPEPVYYYRLSYKGQYSNFLNPETNEPIGAVHQDDLIYLFYMKENFPRFRRNCPKEVEMVETLTKIYANFAATGSPIPTPTKSLDYVNWPPYTVKDQKYLDIGERLVIRERLYEERYREWEVLYPLSYYDDK